MAIGWAASHISRLSRHAEMGWLNVGGYTKDVPKPTEIELLKHVACLCWPVFYRPTNLMTSLVAHMLDATCKKPHFQSATEWTASVHTLHMSKPVM